MMISVLPGREVLTYISVHEPSSGSGHGKKESFPGMVADNYFGPASKTTA